MPGADLAAMDERPARRSRSSSRGAVISPGHASWLVGRRLRGAAAFDLVLRPAARCFRDELLFDAIVFGAGAAGAGFRPNPVCRAISERSAA